jgi:hypothetical protein
MFKHTFPLHGSTFPIITFEAVEVECDTEGVLYIFDENENLISIYPKCDEYQYPFVSWYPPATFAA